MTNNRVDTTRYDPQFFKKPHIVKAVRILKEFRTGSSLPVLVQTDSSELYIVKWHQTGEGPIECLSDWICLHLADAFEIPVPRSTMVEITPDLSNQVIDTELKELIEQNAGINLGLKYLEKTEALDSSQTDKISSRLKDKLFLFDLLLLNVDRTAQNPNILFGDNRIHCIDFSASAEIRTLVTGCRISERNCFPFLRRHPFYNPHAKHEFKAGKTLALLNHITNDIPQNWLTALGSAEKIKSKLISGLHALFTQSHYLLEKRMELLRNVSEDTNESLKQKRIQRRNEFLK
ncbi:MAG: HipA family kinase, partial [Chitinispirillaceae bacterium]